MYCLMRDSHDKHLKFSAQYVCPNELMPWLIYLAFIWRLYFYGDLSDYEYNLFLLVHRIPLIHRA